MAGSGLFDTVPKDKILSFLYEGADAGEINVKELVDFLGLDRAEVATICGDMNIDSVRFDNRMPQQIRNKFIEIANLCELVAKNFSGDPTKTQTWFMVKNPLLEDCSPIELIKDGKLDIVYTSILNESKKPI
jgi:hypothetical protein